jgi:hypothetical protein
VEELYYNGPFGTWGDRLAAVAVFHYKAKCRQSDGFLKEISGGMPSWVEDRHLGWRFNVAEVKTSARLETKSARSAIVRFDARATMVRGFAEQFQNVVGGSAQDIANSYAPTEIGTTVIQYVSGTGAHAPTGVGFLLSGLAGLAVEGETMESVTTRTKVRIRIDCKCYPDFGGSGNDLWLPTYTVQSRYSEPELQRYVWVSAVQNGIAPFDTYPPTN